MATYFDVIVFSMLGGVLSLLGGMLLLSRESIASKVARYATPFAAGGLLAAVFLDLLKDGVEHYDADTVLAATLLGIIVFFLADRFIRGFHHHHDQEEEHTDPSASLIIVGDTLHNALDGVAIASAFLISVPTGIVTTIAVAAHEIPQEIGDFGLLLHKGMKRGKVLLANAASAMATVVAAVITFALGSDDKLPIGLILGLSAGFLLYIALSDIVPTIHRTSKGAGLLHVQTLLLLIGVAVVGLTVQLAHQYIDVEHKDSSSQTETSSDSHNHDHEENHEHE
jgi:zinc and cadmium transporter